MAKPAILNADQVASRLSESIRSISKLTGFSEKLVTLGEVGAILKTCAGRTKVRDSSEIGVGQRIRVSRSLGLSGRSSGEGPGALSINAGRRGPRGRVWLHTRNNKFQLVGQMSDNAQQFTPSKYHFAMRNWLDVKEATYAYGSDLRRSLPAALASAGLARQSWIQIADDLGIVLETVPGSGASPAAIAKARRAIASNGRTYRNGIGTDTFEQNKSYLARLTNQLPYLQGAGLDAILASVLAGRAKYFEQNVGKDVLASHAATARAYPWIRLLTT